MSGNDIVVTGSPTYHKRITFLLKHNYNGTVSVFPRDGLVWIGRVLSVSMAHFPGHKMQMKTDGL